MAVMQGAELLEVLTNAESAKSIDRPGMQKLLALVDARAIQTVKLNRLTRSVIDRCINNAIMVQETNSCAQTEG